MAKRPSLRKILKILWSDLRGELRKEVQREGFEGTVVSILTSAGDWILAALMPAPLATMASYMWNFFVRPTFRAIRKTRNSLRVDYQVRTTPSGLAVLEHPKIVTPQGKVFKPRAKLELPTRELIKPSPDLQASPEIFFTKHSLHRSDNVPNPRRRRLSPRRDSDTLTPFISLLPPVDAQGRSLTRDRLASPEIERTLDRYPRLRLLNEVEYPRWALNSPSSAAPRTPPSRTRSARMDGFLDRRWKDRQLGDEFDSASQDLSLEPGWAHRFADDLWEDDDLLDEDGLWDDDDL